MGSEVTGQQRGAAWPAWSERPVLDTIGAAAVACAHGLLLVRWMHPWKGLQLDTTLQIYAAGAGVLAIVGGLTAIGLSAGGMGERGRAVRRLYGPELRRNSRSLMLVTAFGPGCVVVAMIAQANGAGWAPYVFEFALMWGALRVARVTWLVDRLTAAADRDDTEPQRSPPATLSDDFTQRFAS